MKKIILGLALLAVVAVVVANVSLAGEEKAMSPEMEAYMKQYMAAIEPGDHHKGFEKRSGEWTAVVKHWLAGPQGEPTISNAKCTYEVVLGGRFLTQQMEGEMFGMAYIGMGFSGFDKTSGKHTSYWVDSMGTQSVYAEGECSDHCMTESYTFTTADPISGQTSDVKTVTSIKSDDEHVFEWYMKAPDGSMIKTMEITYTRAGS